MKFLDWYITLYYLCKYMARVIIKLINNQKEYYFEWSTVCDAPITYGMSLEELKEYYLFEYGKYHFKDLEERLKLVEKNGSSSRLYSLKDLIDSNVAGENGEKLTIEQIIEIYCNKK